MEFKEHYRHELKYTVTYWQYLQLRSRFRQVMKPDPHTRENGTYQIRSIYFDNIQDKALREKVYGVARREKFRIRYYNDSFKQITLEKKIKNNNLCMKVSTALSEAECRSLLDGNLEWMKYHSSSLVQELYGKMKYQQLKPRVLVSYTREPYIYTAGNVRITFDWDVRTTMYHQKFLEEKVYDTRVCLENHSCNLHAPLCGIFCPDSVAVARYGALIRTKSPTNCDAHLAESIFQTHPGAMEYPGEMIMEVKFDEFLPRVIQDLIQMDGIRQQSFSKYAACRMYG